MKGLIVQTQSSTPEVSVVLPCLNEEEAIGACIEKIQNAFSRHNIQGEVVVVDNGSEDRSAAIASAMKARVELEPRRGYGSAYLTGFEKAQGKYLIMGDADGTYDFDLIPQFLSNLKNGSDFVTGSRYLHEQGMRQIPFLHRVFGNPALTAILNVLFGTKYSDVYCGFRGFSKEAYERIQPRSRGMEFNLELAINAHLAKLKIKELPIVLGPRKGESKLRTFRDGWRSLRMMLLYCPNKVFLVPGGLFLISGLVMHALVLAGVVTIEGRTLNTGASIMASVVSILGLQVLSLGLHFKTYSWTRRFDAQNHLLSRFYSWFNLEKGLVLGAGLLLGSTVGIGALLWNWVQSAYAPLDNIPLLSVLTTSFIFGVHILFTSLFISAMSITLEERT